MRPRRRPALPGSALPRARPSTGSASLEFVVLGPLVVLAALSAFQIAVYAYATGATQEAARQAARAWSLGRDPGAAAGAALPFGLQATSVTTYGPGHGVRLVVTVPHVSLLPQVQVTREAVLP